MEPGGNRRTEAPSITSPSNYSYHCLHKKLTCSEKTTNPSNSTSLRRAKEVKSSTTKRMRSKEKRSLIRSKGKKKEKKNKKIVSK
jgi:hypothetical protein